MGETIGEREEVNVREKRCKAVDVWMEGKSEKKGNEKGKETRVFLHMSLEDWAACAVLHPD